MPWLTAPDKAILGLWVCAFPPWIHNTSFMHCLVLVLVLVAHVSHIYKVLFEVPALSRIHLLFYCLFLVLSSLSLGLPFTNHEIYHMCCCIGQRGEHSTRYVKNAYRLGLC